MMTLCRENLESLGAITMSALNKNPYFFIYVIAVMLFALNWYLCVNNVDDFSSAPLYTLLEPHSSILISNYDYEDR